MDQDSSNGTVNDKRNWRERLGIGAKEMPKLSDEFKTERAAPTLSKPAPQPVTRTAPMAPRQAPRMAVPPEKRTEPTLSAPQPQQSVLADKLRAQREAAEKLAAQRVNAARERAEAKSSAPEPRLTSSRPAAPQASAERPKFSFADDTPPPAFQPRSSAAGAQPLAPPRPALGGDRGPLPPRGFGSQNGSYRQEPPQYRPIDPATGYSSYGTSKPGYVPPRSYAPPAGGQGVAPLPPRRAAGYEPPRVPVDEGYEDERYQPDPRLTRSMAARPRPAQPQLEEADDVFEDAPAPAPRRRASAAEYNAAYREAEEAVEEPGKRSSGPWLLLLALLLAAVATGGIVWFYQTKMKPVTSAATTTGEQVPVVEAPQQPAKTAAEQPADNGTQTQAVTNKKQIYDRIVGDQEVKGGTVVPTEQPPVQPEPAAATDTGTQPAAADGQAQPAAGAGEEPVPLPLPPPPGDNGTNTQGSLDNNQIQPAANQVAGNSNSAPAQAPAPEAPKDMAAATQQAASDTAASAVPQMEAITDQPAAAPAKPAVEKPAQVAKAAEQKAKAKVTKTTKAVADKSLGSKPVVLVPPSQDTTATTLAVAPGQDTTVSAPSQSVTVEPAPVEPVQKKKTIFDLFKGKSAGDAPPDAAPVQQAEPVQPQQPAQQVASVPKAQTQAPAQTTTGGSGYVAQLASFRSQAEAQQEYARLKSKYPAIVSGLSPNISTGTVAGSTRYRLGLGPMATREDASQVCGSLLASGERDCIVRKQ